MFGFAAVEAGGNSGARGVERTFLLQFLPEVEPAAPFSLAAARGHVLGLGGLVLLSAFCWVSLSSSTR